MRFAVDAMGGDYAPKQIVLGAVHAARRWPDTRLVLVGDPARIEAELKEAGDRPANLDLEPATQVVGMEEHVKDAIRKKPDSSIQKAVNLVREGKADGVISAGHTGVMVATSTLTLGTLPGIKRPGIAVPMPTESGFTTLIDVGANIYPKPEHLLQYAYMGAAYARILRHLSQPPTVGLLSIGEEEGKGNELVQKATELLSKAPFPFKGNVEGNDIFRGKCDVIVCEGFVGNTVLKSCEGCAETVLKIAKAELGALLASGGAGGMGADAAKSFLGKIRARLDYAQYGGAPLLGVNGLTIIAHGRSEAVAIENAIRVAIELTEARLNEQILKSLTP